MAQGGGDEAHKLFNLSAMIEELLLNSAGRGENGMVEKNEDLDSIVITPETSFVDLSTIFFRLLYSGENSEEISSRIAKLNLSDEQHIHFCNQLFQAAISEHMHIPDKLFPRIAVRLCRTSRIYVKTLEEMFRETYASIDSFGVQRLPYVTKFWSYILSMYSISWRVFSCIKLERDRNEDIQSPSSLFIQMIFQDLIEYIGLEKLTSRIKDSRLEEAFEGLFPHNDLEKIIFALEFFNSIGMENMTEDLRKHLDFLTNSTSDAKTVS